MLAPANARGTEGGVLVYRGHRIEGGQRWQGDRSSRWVGPLTSGGWVIWDMRGCGSPCAEFERGRLALGPPQQALLGPRPGVLDCGPR